MILRNLKGVICYLSLVAFRHQAHFSSLARSLSLSLARALSLSLSFSGLIIMSFIRARPPVGGVCAAIQGYLAHQKSPTYLGPP